MRKLFRSAILGLACVAASLPGVAAHAEPQELNFGIISTESSQNLRARWQPFLDDMGRETGFRINAFFASDYAGIVTGMQYNKVQVALYGNKSAIEAVDRAGGEVFAQTSDRAGVGGYYSHLIAHRDSLLNSEKDVLARAGNLSFGNGDPNSTSGFVAPGYYVFAMNHVDPKVIFKRTLNANLETNALSVANRQVDVATSNNVALEHLAMRQPEKRAQIKVIWTSPLIPSSPLVWRKDLPAGVKEKISHFVVGYGTPGRPRAAREKAVLESMQMGPFRASSDDQLLAIRQLELFKDKGMIESNANLDAADKQARIREIDARLAALGARMAALGQAKKP